MLNSGSAKHIYHIIHLIYLILIKLIFNLLDSKKNILY